MATLELKYVKHYLDRHRKRRRYYFRRKGFEPAALPGLPGSPEFMEAYNTAMRAEPVREFKGGAGSIAATIGSYFKVAEFVNLAESTKKTYRLVLKPILEEHGHRPAKNMTVQDAKKIIQKIAGKHKGMANLTRSVLHRIMALAVKEGSIKVNPFVGVTPYKLGKHRTWTDAELKAYAARWPLGTRERLAYALLLYTGQRGGDVVKMKREHIQGGAIRIVQQKTARSDDDALLVDVHPALERAIAAGPAKGDYLLSDADGRRVSRDYLTRLIATAARKAGLADDCTAHGLRKAMMRRLAERGATAKEMASVSGHRTLKEVERYTEAADQARMAKTAISRLPDNDDV